MFYYAELNENKICYSIKSANSEIKDNNHILIESLNDKLLGMKYEGDIWLEVEKIPYKETLTIDERLSDIEVSLSYSQLKSEYLIAIIEMNL